MINRMSHSPVWVLDQDEAIEFYTKKLGFNLKNDVSMDGFRWVTVTAPEQNEVEIILMPIFAGGGVSEEMAGQLRDMVSKGVMGAGVLHTNDCRATYEELKGRGVEFMSPPQERPYGVEATFRDNSGNWFSLTEPRGM